MARKKNHISIVQFDERLISWMRVARSNSGVHVLDTANLRGTWSVEDGSLSRALSAFASEHRIGEDLLYTVLPRHDMTARLLNLPSEDPDEIAGMMRLNAGEYVPYGAEELILDQSIVVKRPSGESRVLAVFAHQDVVKTHLRILESAGLDAEQIYLSTACLASAAIAARPKAAERAALINLASGGLEVLVMEGGTLAYGRGAVVAQDWDAPNAAEEMAEELGAEVRTSLAAYRRESEDGQAPDALYLFSNWADVRPLADPVAQRAGLDCAPGTFARDVAAKGREKLDALPLTLLGAALSAQGRAAIVIELIPALVAERRRRAAQKRGALLGGGLAAAIIAVAAALYYDAVSQRMAVISEIQGRIGAIEQEAKGVVAKQQRLNILHDQVDQKGSALELIAALCEKAPDKGLNIARISFQHDTELYVWGRAASLVEIQSFAKALQDLGKTSLEQFATARSLYELQVAEENKSIYCYEIGGAFPQAAELEASPAPDSGE